MSNAAHILDADVRAAAQAIADSRCARLDEPATDLDRLGPATFAACVADARAVLAALAALPPRPRRAGPLNALDVSALANDLGSEILVVAERGGDGVHRGVIRVRGRSIHVFDAAEAAAFWDRVLPGRDPAPEGGTP